MAQELRFLPDGSPSIGVEIVQFVWFEATRKIQFKKKKVKKSCLISKKFLRIAEEKPICG